MRKRPLRDGPMIDAAFLDAGARRLYGKSWAQLLGDFARVGQTPSPEFTEAVLRIGALAMRKEPPAA